MTISNSQLQTEQCLQPSRDDLNKKKEIFETEVKNFRNQKIAKLRIVNHWWNISLTVAGITFTLLTTVLGVVESDILKGWLKFWIGFSGAVAVSTQSANREFQVRGKAQEYTIVEAEAIILEHQIPNAKDEIELEELRNIYYSLLRRTAEAEASSNKED